MLKESHKLIAHILEEDHCLKSKGLDHTTLAAHDKGKKKKYNPNVTCYKCGKKGYIKPDCHSPDTQGTGKPTQEKGKQRAHNAEEVFSFTVTEGAEDIALAGITQDSWLADSATTSHIVREKCYFQDLVETPGQHVHSLGCVSIIGRGTVKLQCSVEERTFNVELKEALYVPEAPHNLISVTRLMSAGAEANFKGSKVQFVSKNQPFMEGHMVGRLCQMDVTPLKVTERAYLSRPGYSWDQWHRILGHINMGSVKMLKEKNMVTGMDVDLSSSPSLQCAACIQAKQHVLPFPKEAKRKWKHVGDMTFIDLWGPACTTAIGGYKYFISYTDGNSRESLVYF